MTSPGSTDWKSLPLWPHQIRAVEMIEAYLASGKSGSALVRMPTGSGKSGIITILTRCLGGIGDALVLCPHEMLRDQLIDDIKQRFFANIAADNSRWPKAVKLLLPSGATTALKTAGTTVYVGTIQTLQTIYRDQPREYKDLSQRIGLVVFDEGHREPAPEWAEAVRNLKRPTVLCTATPYRNDLKLFNVEPQFIATLPHHEAEQERFIRRIEFLRPERWSSAEEFVRMLLKYWHGDFRQQTPSAVKTPRAIIRCVSADAIREIVQLLIARGETALGIHDTFESREKDGLCRDVPRNPDQRTETFWVHQFKLLEGLDVREFCVLALYHPLGNARSLVQQVGRIIRNPGRASDQRGFVFSRSGDRQLEFWRGYLTYEKDFERQPAINENRLIFDASRDLQPEFQYVEGNYRHRFDPDKPKLYERLLFPFSTLVFELGAGFKMPAFQEALELELKKKDYDIRYAEEPTANTKVRIYVAWANSAILGQDALMEFRLGLTISRKVGNYLFFHDSEGNLCDYLRENARRVSPDKLERLFTGKKARLSNVSVMNSDLGSYSIRRRTIQAQSIGEIAPGLSDHAQFCSTVQGYTEEKNGRERRRYVGLSRARISDRSMPAGNYTEYVKWLNTIAQELDRSVESLSVFERFAHHSSPPAKPAPRNILLDLDGVAEDFHFEDDNKRTIVFASDDLCHEVDNGQFTWRVAGKDYVVRVRFDGARERYVLESPALENLFIRMGDRGSEESVVAYLNRHQAFRIVPESSGCIYAHDRFYKPRHPLHGRSRNRQIDLLQILHPVPVLADAHSEKGRKNTANITGWERGSIFELIERSANATRSLKGHEGLNGLSGVDVLVCDDLNKETADFIAFRDSPREVIFIHAKDGEGSSLSATAFQEVCGQAVKNLDPLVAYSDALPRNLSGWDKVWTNGVAGTVDSRIRRGTTYGKGAEIWKKIRAGIRDPNTVRQVWIVLGQGFSRGLFEAERNRSDPKPETIQILYLLQSTWNAVGAIGAQLKIFCSP